MTSPIAETVREKRCVVCNADASHSNTGDGDWMLVFHYDPPERDHACGHWVHENCRYRNDAPACPCGVGPADEGLTREGVDAMRRRFDPPAPVPRFPSADESVPTEAELEEMERDSSSDGD